MKFYRITFLMLLITVCATLITCKDDDELGSNEIRITSIEPASPAAMQFNKFVIIDYEYNITNEDGARMWVIPQTDGDDSPGYLYSSSKIYTGSGTRQVGVSIDEQNDPVVVDQLQVIMKNPDQSETLFEQFLNVEFTFDK